jgi:hypothetical protein
MQHRSPAVRCVAALLALCAAGVAFSATFATWFTVAWNTGGSGVFLDPARFNLYRLSSPFPPEWNSVVLALILSGVAVLVASAVAILLPARLAKVSKSAPVGVLLGVILLTVGSLTIQRPDLLGWNPFWAIPAFVPSVTPVITQAVGSWMSLLGAALGVAALVVLEVAPCQSHRPSAISYANEGTAAIGI